MVEMKNQQAIFTIRAFESLKETTQPDRAYPLRGRIL